MFVWRDTIRLDAQTSPDRSRPRSFVLDGKRLAALRVGGVNLFRALPMAGKYAVLVDGGFIKKKLQERHKHFPTVAEIQTEVDRIKAHELLRAYTLLRVYFYDAPAATGVITNPLDGKRIDLSATGNHASNTSLHQTLEMQPDFALRSGETAVHGWSLGSMALKSLMKKARHLLPTIWFRTSSRRA